jgi:hypothetical protein
VGFNRVGQHAGMEQHLDQQPPEVRIDTGYETWVFDHARRRSEWPDR